MQQARIGLDLNLWASSGGIVRGNLLSGVDTGLRLTGTENSQVQVLQNRITNVVNGSGIEVQQSGCLIANNFIQAGGVGIAKGISNSGSSNRIVFNSVNITGSDPVNGRAFELTGAVT
nr:NosD domain-containing protein [Hymenobacter sp. DG25B]